MSVANLNSNKGFSGGLLFNQGGCNIPGEDDDFDFGTGAGFYVNATQEPWSRHYRMYDYVTKEVG